MHIRPADTCSQHSSLSRMAADGEAMRNMLASGDVDALRRLLKHGDAQAPTPPPVAAASTSLFSDRPLHQITAHHVTLEFRGVRTMGKLIWPAGHAVALQLAHSASVRPPPQPLAMLEIGAGAGIASLVAAASGAFARGVIATDCFEEVVELIRHNDVLNGHALAAAIRLDIGERGALRTLVQTRLPGGVDGALVLVACDMSYDPDAISSLFRSASELLDASSSACPLLLFARSDNFAHNDEVQQSAATAAGFELLASVPRQASGALDAIAHAHLTPCAEHGCRFFLWGRSSFGGAAAPLAEWLLFERADAAASQYVSGTAQRSEEAAGEDTESLWAPRVSTSPAHVGL